MHTWLEWFSEGWIVPMFQSHTELGQDWMCIAQCQLSERAHTCQGQGRSRMIDQGFQHLHSTGLLYRRKQYGSTNHQGVRLSRCLCWHILNNVARRNSAWVIFFYVCCYYTVNIAILRICNIKHYLTQILWIQATPHVHLIFYYL